MRTTLAAGITLPALLSMPMSVADFTDVVPRWAESAHDLYLGFNGKTGQTPNLTNSGSASVTTAIASDGGGAVVGVRHEGEGRAARLEPFDTDTPAELAVVVVRPSGSQDPFASGDGAFTFGATFRLDAKSEGSSVDGGNNLLQRGLYDDDAQYKIQVDGERLSCRVSGSAGAVFVTAVADLSTRRWYTARCTRKDSSVTLRLVERTADGPIEHRWTRSGAIGTLAFSDGPPLSIGGKVDGDGEVITSSSDQFNGRVDNVFFRRLGG